jgi:glycerol-3-phosphate dehydrogenase
MTRPFSQQGRTHTFAKMKSEIYDVLVIGGGITGAGIALDARSRGMKTALIEMQDFAAGTSSRSTKLVHGGLRYLKQLEIGVVAEVGKERAIVYENGPHVTTPVWMLLPFYKGGTFGAFTTSLGLMLYDYLAGVKRSERRIMLSREETLRKEPLLKGEGLKGGGYYVEYRTDDARLTIEVIKQAAAMGADMLNYVKAVSYSYEGGKLDGVHAVDTISGETVRIRARRVINAAGPWADELRQLDGSKSGKSLRLTKGVHLVFDGSRFPLKQAVYFDTPDGRMVFAIPRDGKTYIGTTDTDYRGDTANPTTSRADRDYVLQAAQLMFPTLGLSERDVESSWAGLRPLIYQEGKSPSEVSRKDEIFRSDSGLITIAGGKLTGYRKMAETVIDLAAKELAAEGAGTYSGSRTRNLPISGGDVGGSEGFESMVRRAVHDGMKLGLPEETARRLARAYGSNIYDIYASLPAIRQRMPEFELPLEIGIPLWYAVEREMAMTPADFFVRRTGAMYFDIEGVRRWKTNVVRAMANMLDYSDERITAYRKELDRLLDEAAIRSEREGGDGQS